MGRKMASLEASSLSPSVMSWFGSELETRGIDAVIYTRYILSILQQEDPSDAGERWEAQFFTPSKNSRSQVTSAGANTNSGASAARADPSPTPVSRSSPAVGSRGRGGAKGRKKPLSVSSEQLKKSAAIECLLSLSDEDSGIENLVEELYLKLKEHEALKDSASASATLLCSCQLTESSSESCDSGTDDPAERYYAAFPALGAGAERLKPSTVKIPATNSVWATSKHLLGGLGGLTNEQDSGSSSRDSSGERPEGYEEEDIGTDVTEEYQNNNNNKGSGGKKAPPTGSRKSVSFDKKLVQTGGRHCQYSTGGGKRRGQHCRRHEDDSDKENSHRSNTRGQQRIDSRHHGNNINRDHYINSTSASGSAASSENAVCLRMRSPHGAASWSGCGGVEPKFVVPRMKAHIAHQSPAVKMKMRQDNDLTSPLWAELVFSSDEEFDKVISESTSINSVIRRLLDRGKNWRSVDLEDQAWYTDPIDFLWPSSPSQQRLYKRQSSLPDVSGINLSKIFEESEQDEGFFGVGEEHQSAALNVIAVLFGTDGCKDSPFKQLLRLKEHEDEAEEDEDYTVQFEMDMDNERSGADSVNDGVSGEGNGGNVSEAKRAVNGESNNGGDSERNSGLHSEVNGEGSDEKGGGVNCRGDNGSISEVNSECSRESIPRDPCSSDNLSELLESLTDCSACSQLQQNTIGATSPTFTRAFHRTLGDPLYRRRSSGLSLTEGSATDNTPKSTENKVPDDRPDSGDLNLEELFHLGALSDTVCSRPPDDLAVGGSLSTTNMSSIVQLSSTLSSQSSLPSSSSVHSNINNSFSLHSNKSFTLQSAKAHTGSCLNPDFGSQVLSHNAPGAQTLPVVVVASASGLDLEYHENSAAEDDSVPKATFHWTMDESCCHDDAGEALLSPDVLDPSDTEDLVEEPYGVAAHKYLPTKVDSERYDSVQLPLVVNPEMLSSLCLSQLSGEGLASPSVFSEIEDSPQTGFSPPVPLLPPSGCGETMVSPVPQSPSDGCGEELVSSRIQESYCSSPALRTPSIECGENPASLHHQHLDIQALHARGTSLSADDDDCVGAGVEALFDLPIGPLTDSTERVGLGAGVEVQSSIPAGPWVSLDDGEGAGVDGEGPGVEGLCDLHTEPRVDSAELRLNLDFILDDEEEDLDYNPSDLEDYCNQSPCSYHRNSLGPNEALSAPEEEFLDLQTELKLNLDFIDEEENPGDLSLEEVYRLDEPPPTNIGCEHVESAQVTVGSNSLTTRSVICDTIANCEGKTRDNKSAVKNNADQNNSTLYFLNGDFGIWSSVFESVTGRSPQHFWPAQFTQGVERASSVIEFPVDASELWGTSAGSIFLGASGNPWGTTAWGLPISPRRSESAREAVGGCRPTSRLWDVNLQKISSEFESPRERCPTIENIQRYLLNPSFCGSSPFTSPSSAVGGPSMLSDSPSAFISGGIYSIKLDSESSIWTLNHSSLWGRRSVLDWNRRSVIGCEHNIIDWTSHTLWGSDNLPRLLDHPTSTLRKSPLFNLSPPPEDPDPGLWNNFSTKSRFIHKCSSSLENLSDPGAHEYLVTHHNALRRVHPRLQPSENSAFSDITPPRLPHLPHVHSDPALSLNSALRHQQYQQLDCNGRKLVQVKSLYKSDHSVLLQLGLTTGGVSPLRSEQLQYSPETHFKPIATPVINEQQQQQAQCQHKPEDDDSPIPIYVGRSSSYQWYHEGETRTTNKKPFIPRFRVNKATEKYIQTGDSIEEVEENLSEDEEFCVTPVYDTNPIELLLSDMQDVLEIEEGEDTERLVQESLSSTPGALTEKSGEYDASLEEFGNLAELWDAHDGGGGERPGEEPPTGATDKTNAYQTIWSCRSEPALQQDQVEMYSLQDLCAQQVSMEFITVESDSGDDSDNVTLVTKATTPVALETLPFKLDPDHSPTMTSLQAFLDSGLPGYFQESQNTAGQLNSSEDLNTAQENVRLWLSDDERIPDYSQDIPAALVDTAEDLIGAQDELGGYWLSDDDADEMLDLIEIRKHWTTPTEELDVLDEQQVVELDTSLNIAPNTWGATGHEDGATWSFSEADLMKHWMTFESKNMQVLKSRWSDIDEQGTSWGKLGEQEANGNSSFGNKRCAVKSMSVDGDMSALWDNNVDNASSVTLDKCPALDKSGSCSTKSLSLDGDLSGLWNSNVEHVGEVAVDQNKNPVGRGEHFNSWPSQHYLSNHGNSKHWFSAGEETIPYPSDWIVDENNHSVTKQKQLRCAAQEDLTHNNNNKPHIATKHWSLGDHTTEEVDHSFTHRHFSLQDSDLKLREPWNTSNGNDGGLESLWIQPTGTSNKASEALATNNNNHSNNGESLGREVGAKFSSDLERIWLDSLEPSEAGVRPEWLSVSDDVFLTDTAQEDNKSSEEVFTCGEGPPPKEQAVYSDQLEQSWMSDSHFQVQVPRKLNRLKLGPSQKPCSYFMEGHCRRVDCKFAHDMSSITCRFWEEGVCFKGVTCPFLHGYPNSLGEVRREDENSEVSDPESDFYLDEGEFPHLEKTDSDPHPAQLTAEKRCAPVHQNSKQKEAPFVAYTKNENETSEEPAHPLTNTASEVDKESNEKVI